MKKKCNAGQDPRVANSMVKAVKDDMNQAFDGFFFQLQEKMNKEAIQTGGIFDFASIEVLSETSGDIRNFPIVEENCVIVYFSFGNRDFSFEFSETIEADKFSINDPGMEWVFPSIDEIFSVYEFYYQEKGKDGGGQDDETDDKSSLDENPSCCSESFMDRHFPHFLDELIGKIKIIMENKGMNNINYLIRKIRDNYKDVLEKKSGPASKKRRLQ